MSHNKSVLPLQPHAVALSECVAPCYSLLQSGSCPTPSLHADDMTIKLWDWEKKWSCIQVFEGHTHYVMMIVLNPKDTNQFASGSLDRTIKVWQLGSSHPNFTLEGHEKGVNCIDYFQGGDKPHLVSGADDRYSRGSGVWQATGCPL